MSDQGRSTVLTIGYGGSSLGEILDQLADYGVDRVVDIRAVAESTVEGFSSEELARALGEAGMAYVHIGELGDFQPEPYPEYMETETWQEGYQALARVLAEDGTTCLLSKPQSVGQCHRRFLQVALAEDGYRVVHITPAGPREAPTLDG